MYVPSKINPQTDKKLVLITLLGNILEFYDLGLYGFFSLTITPLFFPSNNSLSLLIAGMGVFAAGFLMRPVGSIIFGHIGDKYGRKVSLSYAILFMAIPTFLIGVLPTYAQIGITAPIILIMCRLLQGCCTGGEYNNAAIFILEHCQVSKRGFYSGLITASSIIGFLIASSMAILVIRLPFPLSFSWRFPFIFGAFIGIIGFYFRLNGVLESPVFNKHNTDGGPFKNILKINQRSILSTIGIGWFAGTASLPLVGYMGSYLTTVVRLSQYRAGLISNLGLIVYMAFLPIMGSLSDKIGHRKLMQIGASLTLVFSYPFYKLLTTGTTQLIIIGQVGLAVLASIFLGPMHAYMLSIFPVQFRCRGISTSFALGIGFLGGTTPLISTLLIQYFNIKEAPAFYLIFSGIVGLIATSMKISKVYVENES